MSCSGLHLTLLRFCEHGSLFLQCHHFMRQETTLEPSSAQCAGVLLDHSSALCWGDAEGALLRVLQLWVLHTGGRMQVQAAWEILKAQQELCPTPALTLGEQSLDRQKRGRLWSRA